MEDADRFSYMKGQNMNRYFYGMRLRGYSLGCQPMNGLIMVMDDSKGDYHSILVYTRRLSDQELSDYELDMLDIE